MKEVILKVLNDPLNKSYGELFYGHPSIEAIKRKKGALPFYISSAQFAEVLIDMMVEQGRTYERNGEIVKETSGSIAKSTYQKYLLGVGKLNPSNLSILLSSFSNTIPVEDNAMSKLKEVITKWYDDYMDRVTGWYKRYSQKCILYMAMVITMAFNIDTIAIFKEVKSNDDLRDKLALSALQWTLKSDSLKAVTSNNDFSRNDSSNYNYYKALGIYIDSVSSYSFPIGWKSLDEINKERTQKAVVSCNSSSPSVSEKSKKFEEESKSIELALLECLELGGCEIKIEKDTKTITYQKDTCNCLTENRRALYDLKERKTAFEKKKRETVQKCKREKKYETASIWDAIGINLGMLNFWTLIGWAISVFAISRGGAFWFDNMVKLVNIRGAGIKPNKANG